MPNPIGPPVDAAPRPWPPHDRIPGRACVLEPLAADHAPDLWRAADGAGESWDYLGYGPFPSLDAMRAHVERMASGRDPLFWAVRLADGVAGWLSLMDIQPENAAIELGHIWFSPRLQRTRASTEAMVLLLRLAAGELGYRRLVWKCNALNAPSRRAAARLGFVHEGTLRAHMIVKGRSRDTAYFSIVAGEWPSRRDAFAAWLDDANFGPDGQAIRSLSAIMKEAVAPCSR